MGRSLKDLPHRVRNFLGCWWDSDLRECMPRVRAIRQLRQEGLTEAVRTLLVETMANPSVGVDDWADFFNIGVCSPSDLHEDAEDLWNWLFDGEPLPERAQHPTVRKALTAHRVGAESVRCSRCSGTVTVEVLCDATYVYCPWGCTDGRIIRTMYE